MNDVIHIAMAGDERYLPGGIVAAAGMAAFARPETQLVFHLFTEDVREGTVELFRRTVIKNHVRSHVVQVPVSDEMLKVFPRWCGSRIAGLRCNFAEILTDVDWCLYVDCDVLYLASVEGLYHLRDNDKYVMACAEGGGQTAQEQVKWIENKTGLHIPAKDYFLSGMLLMNLKKMREDKVAEKIAQFFGAHPDVKFPDMDALNYVLFGRVGFVPETWNLVQTKISEGALKQHPVVHYVLGNPWLPKYACVANGRFRLWHAFADKYVWRRPGESMRRLFSRKMILAKYLSYYLLRTPLVGQVFALSMQLLGFTKAGQQWRHLQIDHDCSSKEIAEVLK